MSKHEIRFCRADEKDLLQDFIEHHWKPGHVLAHHTPLLNWQYLDSTHERYNFAVAYNPASQTFDAILGFIPLAHFDPDLAPHRDHWLAIWKNTQKGSLGLDLLNFLEENLNPASLAGLGASAVATRIYDLLKFQTGTIHHYAIFHPDTSSYQIADQVPPVSLMGKTALDLRLIENPLDLNEIETIFRPRKSMRYLYNRYVKHPVYTYQIYGLYEADTLRCIWVLRKVEANGACCLRLVDMHGHLPDVSPGRAVQDLIRDERAEYLDCINMGMDTASFERMGFLTKQPPLVLPNYFDPFERSNVDLVYMVKFLDEENKTYHLFKGDTDQDRPNRLEGAS